LQHFIYSFYSECQFWTPGRNLTGNSLQLRLVLLLATEITHFIFRLYKMLKQMWKFIVKQTVIYFSSRISSTNNALSSWTVPIVSAPVVEHKRYMDWKLTCLSLSCRSLRRSWLCCSSRL